MAKKTEITGTCHIMGAGEYTGGFRPSPGDLIIAADGGWERLRDMGIMPDLIVGDFDSAGEIPAGKNVSILPREKDDTDMLAAVKLGCERGANRFHLWGGTGGRGDHTMANIQLLHWLSKRGMCGILHGKNNLYTAITDRRIRFDAGCRGYISVFSLSDYSLGVTETGLKYTLNNGELTSDMPLGVSNEFIGRPSCIEVRKGTLLIAYENQEDL